jgi:hypothetical protein
MRAKKRSTCPQEPLVERSHTRTRASYVTRGSDIKLNKLVPIARPRLNCKVISMNRPGISSKWKCFVFFAPKFICQRKIMSDRDKVLNFLRDNDGQTNKTQITITVFKSGRSVSELNALLASDLAGLVTVRKRKKTETWKLTKPGWAIANQLSSAKPQESQQEPASEEFARFKALAKENPDASPQRLLQLAGRSLGDPLSWPAEWREARPEWFLGQPRDWYSRDVELDADGYPLRLPESPLTGKEQNARPTNERAWLNWAMRQPGASLEPLAVEMPAFECANILRTVQKIGEPAATEIFGPEKIATARRLAGLE